MTTITIEIPTWFCQIATLLLVINIMVVLATENLNKKIVKLRESQSDMLLEILDAIINKKGRG